MVPRDGPKMAEEAAQCSQDRFWEVLAGRGGAVDQTSGGHGQVQVQAVGEVLKAQSCGACDQVWSWSTEGR